jgi:lipopolysaccharide biosynthesis glycosyltransferase
MSVEYLEYDKNKQYFSDIGKEKAVNYINGGCILFNNKKIIRDRLYEKFLQEAKNNYALNEQHILNLVCSKTILDFIFSSFNNRV